PREIQSLPGCLPLLSYQDAIVNVERSTLRPIFRGLNPISADAGQRETCGVQRREAEGDGNRRLPVGKLNSNGFLKEPVRKTRKAWEFRLKRVIGEGSLQMLTTLLQAVRPGPKLLPRAPARLVVTPARQPSHRGDLLRKDFSASCTQITGVIEPPVPGMRCPS